MQCFKLITKIINGTSQINKMLKCWISQSKK